MCTPASAPRPCLVCLTLNSRLSTLNPWSLNSFPFNRMCKWYPSNPFLFNRLRNIGERGEATPSKFFKFNPLERTLA